MREDNNYVSVYSDQISSIIEGREIELPKHTFGIVDQDQGEYQKDLAAAMVTERVHMWWNKRCSCPDKAPCVHDNPCYFLFGGEVYVAHRKRELDYHTNPPTVFELEVSLDLVEDDPGSIRDILLSRPPSVRGMLF